MFGSIFHTDAQTALWAEEETQRCWQTLDWLLTISFFYEERFLWLIGKENGLCTFWAWGHDALAAQSVQSCSYLMFSFPYIHLCLWNSEQLAPDTSDMGIWRRNSGNPLSGRSRRVAGLLQFLLDSFLLSHTASNCWLAMNISIPTVSQATALSLWVKSMENIWKLITQCHLSFQGDCYFLVSNIRDTLKNFKPLILLPNSSVAFKNLMFFFVL